MMDALYMCTGIVLGILTGVYYVIIRFRKMFKGF